MLVFRIKVSINLNNFNEDVRKIEHHSLEIPLESYRPCMREKNLLFVVFARGTARGR